MKSITSKGGEHSQGISTEPFPAYETEDEVFNQ